MCVSCTMHVPTPSRWGAACRMRVPACWSTLDTLRAAARLAALLKKHSTRKGRLLTNLPSADSS